MHEGIFCSVVIPTTGRPSLIDNIQRILADADRSSVQVSIIVALNGSLERSLPSDDRVKLLQVSKEPCGVSRAVNAGIASAPQLGLMWTMADDDKWLAGKFRHDIEFLNKKAGKCLLLPRAFLRDEAGTACRPKRPIGEGEPIFDYLYGKRVWLRNPNFVTLSGSVALAEIWKAFPFPASTVREDIELLKTIQEQGISICHGYEPTVQLEVSLRRSSDRDNAMDALQWSRKLSSSQLQYAFICGAWGKTAAAAGNFKELRRMIQAIMSGKQPSFRPYLRLKASLLLSLLLLFSITIGLFRLLNSQNNFLSRKIFEPTTFQPSDRS